MTLSLDKTKTQKKNEKKIIAYQKNFLKTQTLMT